jgi:hypothetical protein
MPLGAPTDANRRAVSFDHFDRRERTRADNLDVPFGRPIGDALIIFKGPGWLGATTCLDDVDNGRTTHWGRRYRSR